jgi:hypothetical protein
MFSSGLTKLTWGDPTWRGLTALAYHYWTQPIPTPLAWYASHLPRALQILSCAAMFVVELALPFLVFAPRRPRRIALVGFLALQALIAATGNYGFFNLLAAVLCVPLLDDQAWPAALRSRLLDDAPPATRGRAPSRTALVSALAAFVALLRFLLSSTCSTPATGAGTPTTRCLRLAEAASPLLSATRTASSAR